MIYKIMNIRELNEELTKKYYPMLSERKKQTIAKPDTPEERARQFCAEVVVRQCLSELTGAPEKSFDILLNPGKTGAVANAGVQISCAAARDFVLGAASFYPLGTDITKIEPFNFVEMQNYLSDRELRSVFGMANIGMAQAIAEPVCTDKKAVCRLNAVLSAKRACFNAMGKQLDMPYKSLEMPFTDRIRCTDERYETTVSEFDENKQYVFTVVERKG